MTRAFVPLPLAEGSDLALPEAVFRHLVQVLRLREGERFVAFNGDGREFEAELIEVAKRGARARVGRGRNVDLESPLQLTLAQCVSKGERMEFTLQKAVELGVQRIQPLLSARSVVRLDGERWEKKLEHWRGIVTSACEQCGRARLPELAPVQTLERWIPHSDRASVRLTLDPRAEHSLRSLPPASAVTLLIGPEGGLAPDEVTLAHQQGFQPVRLGPRVLRTETAGIAAIAALQALWGDWQ